MVYAVCAARREFLRRTRRGGPCRRRWSPRATAAPPIRARRPPPRLWSTTSTGPALPVFRQLRYGFAPSTGAAWPVLPPRGRHRRAARRPRGRRASRRRPASAARRGAAASPTPRRSTCCERGDLLELGYSGRRSASPPAPGDDVTFIVDRNINYTNVCISGCSFCAFHRRPDRGGLRALQEEIYAKIEETLALGGTAVMMQGGLHPDLRHRLFRAPVLRHQGALPDPHPLPFAARDGAHRRASAASASRETLARLQAAGLDTLPGGGAEILVDRVRQRSARTRSRPTSGWTSCARPTLSAWGPRPP